MAKNKINNIPVFNALIEENDEGVYCVSLVTNPATEVPFVYFNEDKPIQKFAIAEDAERVVAGVVMLADTPIYRRTESGFEYFINYSKDTLKQMAEKMIFDNVGSVVNIEHIQGSNVEGVNLQQLFVIDREKGINPEFFSDVPDGSLIGYYKVNNDDVWEMIENGTVLSFSLEGIFSMEEKFTKEMNNNKINKKDNMSGIAKFVKSLMQFGQISTDKGNLYWEGEGELAVGAEVFVDGENEEKVPAENGEYKIEGKTIIVEDGKVSEIKEDEVPEEKPAEETIVTLNLKQERFNKVKELYEESYEEKERKIIEAIRSVGFSDSWLIEAGEDYAVIENWNEEIGDYKHIRFSISWDAEGNVIVGDFSEVKPAFVPVEENVPEVVEENKPEEFSEIVISKENEDKPEEDVEKHIDGGNETLEEPQPEERDEKEEKIEALQGEVEALKTEIADIRASLANIVQQPAAEPIVTEFEAVKQPEKETKMSKAAKLLSHLNS